MPNPTVTPVTVRVFPISTDYDVILWPETTQGNLIVCYRDGAVYLDNLDTWEPYAEKTALRTFVTGTQPSEPGAVISTPSYVVYWRHLPALQLARQRLLDNEKVVQGVDLAWKGMALDPGAPRLIWGSGPGCVPVM